MANARRTQILLTNDDGIQSPGLWAAAEALSQLGYVTVAAPREQASGSGRSMPPASDGRIRTELVTVGEQEWQVYAVGGSPAQTVQHAIFELMPVPPDLVVAGVNYGENLTTSITISGPVGAALEAASFGIPAMALSLETPREHHLTYSESVDFSVAAAFGVRFGRMLLTGSGFEDVDVLKVDVPAAATLETKWQVCALERSRYYLPRHTEREHLDEPGRVDYDVIANAEGLTPGSDAYVVRVEQRVAVTPLSLDLTSRIDLHQLESDMRRRMQTATS